MEKYKKLLAVIISLFLLGFFVLGIYLPKDFSLKEEVVFNVSKGEGSREISFNLEKAGLINWAPLFRFYVLTAGIGGNLQAGSYSLNSSMNIPQISGKFAKGEVIKEFFTVPEGWDLRDIAQAFESRGMFEEEAFWQAAGFPAVDYSKSAGLPPPLDFSEKYSFLKDKPENAGLEGYLFPDTYQINKQQTLESTIEAMLSNFDKKLTMDLRSEISRQGKTIFEVVIMASLIEKEVRAPEDKELVSGILWKRLNMNMPLQVDATVSYITGKKNQAVLIKDIQAESPFNTYKYKGLPLGPIANPGIESIKAVLYPKESNYLYYLSTREGETIFSRNLEEHNAAKAKYLR